MTTSQYGGLVLWDPTVDLINGGAHIDVASVNDGLLNNAAHLVDEQSQMLVNWIAPRSSQFETWQTPTAAAGFPSPVAAYDVFLHPRANGQPPRLVVECLGAWATNSGTVTFIVGVRSRDELVGDLTGSGPVAPAAGIDAVSFAFASSTPAWATPQTLDFHATRTVESMRVPFGGAGSIYARLAASGAPAPVDLIQARIEVWAYSTSTSTLPRLFGLQVREFCGPGT